MIDLSKIVVMVPDKTGSAVGSSDADMNKILFRGYYRRATPEEIAEAFAKIYDDMEPYREHSVVIFERNAIAALKGEKEASHD